MREFNNTEMLKHIDEVLFYIWDPIGVSPDPYVRAEYTSHAAVVRSILEQSDTIEPISEHLASIVKNYMEIEPDKKQCDYTAEVLLRNIQAIIEGCA
ncbi:MAG: hypothetical protein ACYS80_16435 [Planctomycetota bacterium]|jgi:hypothetical protein